MFSKYKISRFVIPAMLAVMVLVPLQLMAASSLEISIEQRKGRVVTLPSQVSSVLVANSDIADVEVRSPTQIFIYGRSLGETNVYAYDEGDKQLFAAVIQVTHNLSAAEKTVKELIPNSKVRFRSTDRGLVVDGSVDSPAAAEEVMRIASTYVDAEAPLVNMLRVGGSSQVTLRVRVAEVEKSVLKNFGINLENILTRGSFVFSIARGRDFFDEENNTLIRSADGQDNIFLGNQRGDSDLNAMIDALETEGFAKKLAEPTLTAISGRPASFLAGGEVPIPVPDDDGRVTIDYRPFGISLNFTPTVMSNKRINLAVNPEVSTISQIGEIQLDGFEFPSFTVRRASTTVELGSGQSIAIAGLIQSDTNNDVNKFPWLGDIPVLGALFKSTNFQRDETELVIVVTPYLVNPVNEADIKLPGEDIVPPTDFERIFLSKMFSYRNTKGSNASVGIDSAPLAMTPDELARALPKHHGNIGYILEEQ
jgi:pilus assembly protein CpaC